MDPITIGLATKAMAVLLPYVAKSGEEFAKAAGQDAYKKSKGLFEYLKRKFSGDLEAAENLKRFEEKPERYAPIVEDILKEKLSQDKVLAEEMDRLLKEMGPGLEIIQRMKIGEKITGLEADEVVSGKAKVIQDLEQARDVTGAKIKRLG
jgi:hypothetical protein